MILNYIMRLKMERAIEWEDYLAIMRNLRWYREQNLNIDGYV